MSRYRPRRLRPPRLPRAIVTSHANIDPEWAVEIQRVWMEACRRRSVLIVNGTQFDVQVLR